MAKPNSLHGIGLPDNSPLRGNWYITPHAIKQYQARCDRYSSYEQCKSNLIAMSCTARFIKYLSEGISLYRTGKPQQIRLIVSERLPGKPQLVTVLK